MKTKVSVMIVAASMWVVGSASALDAAAPAGLAAQGTARFDDDAGQPTQEDLNKAFGAALSYLASIGDEEAKSLVQQAQENNGQIQVTMEQAKAIVDRAAKAMQNGGKLDPSTKDDDKEDEKETEQKEDDKPLFPPDEARVKEAIRLLAKDGDEEAKQIIEDFKKTRKLDVSDDKGWELIGRAVDKELMKAQDGDPKIKPKDGDKKKDEKKDGADDEDKEKAAAKEAAKKRAEEAVKALAKKGDKDARAVLERARRSRGDLQLTDEEAKTFIERAVDKELIEPEKVGPAEGEKAERMDPQQLNNIARQLEQRGDRVAKRILRDKKRDTKEGETVKFTKEEEKELIERAKKEGVL